MAPGQPWQASRHPARAPDTAADTLCPRLAPCQVADDVKFNYGVIVLRRAFQKWAGRWAWRQAAGCWLLGAGSRHCDTAAVVLRCCNRGMLACSHACRRIKGWWHACSYGWGRALTPEVYLWPDVARAHTVAPLHHRHDMATLPMHRQTVSLWLCCSCRPQCASPPPAVQVRPAAGAAAARGGARRPPAAAASRPAAAAGGRAAGAAAGAAAAGRDGHALPAVPAAAVTTCSGVQHSSGRALALPFIAVQWKVCACAGGAAVLLCCGAAVLLCCGFQCCA
jgi:hypothetical protein